MIAVQYPSFSFNIKSVADKEQILDMVRRKWVVLTPEEWVRQNILCYLLQTLKYPAKLIAVEKKVLVGNLSQRADIMVYKDNKPWMIIECKAMTTTLTPDVLHQALRYNMGMPATYLIITNGHLTYGWHRHDEKLLTIDSFPAY